jgi:tetratricopeptide (TPR) repeat protein
VDAGEIYWHRGDWESALRHADWALSLTPDYVPALSLRARALALSDRNTEAIAMWRKAVDLLPTTRDLVDLTEALERAGDFDAAEQVLRRAEALAADDPRPVAHYYVRYEIKPRRALELAESELRSRRNIAALDTYALALLRTGQVAPARHAIDQALALGTPDAALRLHAGLIALAEGRRDQAQARLDEAMSLNPRVDPVLRQELAEALVSREN